MSAHIPVIIYLQWHGDEDPEFLTEEEKSRKPTLDEVSWCWEQIFPYDIIYIRNDKYAELEQKNSALEQAFNDVCNQRDQLEAERDALQQRCEELVADLITYSCHKPDCNLVAVKSMRCVCTCGLDKAIAKQVQPCNTPPTGAGEL